MTIPLLILGSGTFALETLDIAETAGGFHPLGFVNSVEPQVLDATPAALPIFWIDEIPFKPADCFLVTGARIAAVLSSRCWRAAIGLSRSFILRR